MLSGNTYYFGAGVLHFHLAGDQTDEGSGNEYDPADPDPRDQREHVCLDHGALVIFGHAAEIQIQIFVDLMPQSDFTDALAAGKVEALFGCKRAKRLAVS